MLLLNIIELADGIATIQSNTCSIMMNKIAAHNIPELSVANADNVFTGLGSVAAMIVNNVLCL